MIYKLFLIFCLYLPFQLALNPAEGIDLASVRVIIPILFLLWLLVSLKKKEIYIPGKIQTLLILSFLFLNAFSLVFADNVSWGLRKLLFLLSIVPLYFVVADFARENIKAKKIIEYLIYGGSLAAVVGIFQFVLQFIIGIDPALQLWAKVIAPFLGTSFSGAVLAYPSWLVNLGGETIFRAVSTFPDPHMFSFYLGLLLPFAVITGFSYTRENLPKGRLFILLSFLILLANLLTFSRGGYVGLGFGLIASLFLFKDRINLTYRRILVVLVIAAILILAVPGNPVSNRLYSSFDFSEESTKGRMEMWSKSLETMRVSPWGVGLGNYPLEVKPSAEYREPIYAHNLYLDIGAETGVVNVVVWALLIVASVRSFLRKSKQDIIYLGGMLGLVIFSFHSLFETALFSVQVLPLVIIFIALSTAEDEK